MMQKDDASKIVQDPFVIEEMEKKFDFFGKFRGELGIELNHQLQEQKDILPKKSDIMKQFLIQVGYDNCSAAIAKCRKLPNKFQRQYLENKLKKKREDNLLVKRVELRQKYHNLEMRREGLNTMNRIKDVKA